MVQPTAACTGSFSAIDSTCLLPKSNCERKAHAKSTPTATNCCASFNHNSSMADLQREGLVSVGLASLQLRVMRPGKHSQGRGTRHALCIGFKWKKQFRYRTREALAFQSAMPGCRSHISQPCHACNVPKHNVVFSSPSLDCISLDKGSWARLAHPARPS